MNSIHKEIGMGKHAADKKDSVCGCRESGIQ